MAVAEKKLLLKIISQSENRNVEYVVVDEGKNIILLVNIWIYSSGKVRQDIIPANMPD